MFNRPSSVSSSGKPAGAVCRRITNSGYIIQVSDRYQRPPRVERELFTPRERIASLNDLQASSSGGGSVGARSPKQRGGANTKSCFVGGVKYEKGERVELRAAKVVVRSRGEASAWRAVGKGKKKKHT